MVINYSLEELKTLSDVIVNRYARSLDQYLKDNPNAKTIPIERKIIKVISKHIVLLESPFPLPRTQSSYEISIIKQKTRNDIEHSFNLMIYGDYVYCFRCEFLVYYNTGDSLFVVCNDH